MKTTLYPLILGLFFVLVGCEKIIDESELVIRKGIHYQINSDKPFAGTAVSYHENGQIYTSTAYKNGLKDGLSEKFYDNGQLWSSVNYFMGGKEGIKETYFSNGQLRLKESYKNDEFKEKLIRYDEEGNEVLYLLFNDDWEISESSEVIEKEEIIDEENNLYDWSYFRKSNNEPFTGNVISLYPGGELNFVLFSVNGEEEGVIMGFYENGELMYEGNYVAGRETGIWKDYDEDGTLSSTLCYLRGEIVDESFCKER